MPGFDVFSIRHEESPESVTAPGFRGLFVHPLSVRGSRRFRASDSAQPVIWLAGEGEEVVGFGAELRGRLVSVESASVESAGVEVFGCGEVPEVGAVLCGGVLPVEAGEFFATFFAVVEVFVDAGAEVACDFLVDVLGEEVVDFAAAEAGEGRGFGLGAEVVASGDEEAEERSEGDGRAEAFAAACERELALQAFECARGGSLPVGVVWGVHEIKRVLGWGHVNFNKEVGGSM